MSTDPKQKFVDAAHRLFSRHGYSGVSLQDVAEGLGLSKQAILYHFKTKEALYSAVLEQLAERFGEQLDEAVDKPGEGAERLENFIIDLHRHLQNNPEDARLVARELLDNVDRAASGRKWYLKPFLDTIVDLMLDMPGWEKTTVDQRAAGAYQLIGAVSYFAISEPTLKGIWGKERLKGMQAEFLPVLLEHWLLAEPPQTKGV